MRRYLWKIPLGSWNACEKVLLADAFVGNACRILISATKRQKSVAIYGTKAFRLLIVCSLQYIRTIVWVDTCLWCQSVSPGKFSPGRYSYAVEKETEQCQTQQKASHLTPQLSSDGTPVHRQLSISQCKSTKCVENVASEAYTLQDGVKLDKLECRRQF